MLIFYNMKDFIEEKNDKWQKMLPYYNIKRLNKKKDKSVSWN